MKKESGERTLLASVILSSPGPIVVGIGLFLGRSSTQLADFIRRTAELAAIIVSWAIYRVTHKNPEYDENHRQRLERIAGNCVGAALCLSGIAMLLVTFLYPSKEKGNVTAGLIIAVLGVITNSWFWIRYKMLNKTNPNRILAVQSRLVSVCPGSPAAYYMDIAGSAAVAVYLLINGADTLFGRPKESFA